MKRGIAWASGMLVAAAAFLWPVLTTQVQPGLQDAKVGRVVDAETRAPIRGAHVVVYWYHRHVSRFFLGPGGGGGTRCLQRLEATTDAEGRFLVRATPRDIEVERRFSIEWENAFFIGFKAYAPGYYQPRERVGSFNEPSFQAHVFDGLQAVEPLALTHDKRAAFDRASMLVGVPLHLMCMGYPGDRLSFVGEVYSEALPLVCEQGGSVFALSLAELRLNAVPVLPAMPKALTSELEAILQDHRQHAATDAENARVCELLRRAPVAAL